MSIRIRRFAWFLLLCTSADSTLAFARHRDVFRTTSRCLSGACLDDFDELPVDFPRRDDVLVALSAVRKACRVTNQLQPRDPEAISTVTKTDLSPVTVADYAAQALVLDHLHEAFPKDSFIAEESSTSLDKDANLAEHVRAASSMSNVEHLKKSIDLGKDYLNWEKRGGRPPRVWCLDPIDGTKGFLRGKPQGGQYCVALALLEVRQNMSVISFVVEFAVLTCVSHALHT
jgi:3'-phosphoadenosine 5'-phosphosulfate (PAPS) 3'-phosphatase